MKIGIVGMFVKDLEGARRFFEDCFGADLAFEYNREETGYYSYIMNVGDSLLELMTKPEIIDEKKDPNRTGYAHIGINVDSREKFDEIVKRFHDSGYSFFYEPATVGGNELRAVTFEDNIIEVSYDIKENE